MAYPLLDCLGVDYSDRDEMINRSDFPKNFVFGSATAAHQVEGAVSEGGRGPSIWDTFSHTEGRTADGDHADFAVDQYHRYEEDIENLKSMNMDAYRFSVSWSRILPDGRGPGVNKEGIAYYNRLIDALLSRGIEPYITLYHWDMPQALEDSIGGWLSREIAEHFATYAEACFAAFGDRVKQWITFNEPHNFAWFGYGSGFHAPGRTSDRSVSPVGNSSTEPYIVTHNVLLAHAAAVDVYRRKYEPVQRGKIGMTMDNEWAEPMTDSPEDIAAAERRNLYQIGWFLDPIYFGDYPKTMREKAGARLPTFTEEERNLLRDSMDFIGINNYTTKWISDVKSDEDPATRSFWKDQCVTVSKERNSVPIGPQAFSDWLAIVPWGFERMLLWLSNRYKAPIYITENGMDTKNKQLIGQPVPRDSIQDIVRIKYYNDYLKATLSAIRKGADVRCYFAWSLVDNFEWALGYRSRFGLFYVDYFTQKRYPKMSALWFTKFLQPKDENPCPTM